MEKLRFEFVVKASPIDSKTNIIAITSIKTTEHEIFNIPVEFQNVALHEKLRETEGYKKIKKTLARRGENRKVWITLDEELLKKYKDEDGNMKFEDYLLEQKNITNQNSLPATGISTETLQQILDKFSEIQKPAVVNLKKVSDKFAIEKFTGRNENVLQWIEIFENECSRLGVEEDINKIEILRLFLEGSCIDWYSSMLIKFTLNSEWEVWKKNFCDTYINKGWTSVRYAIEYKYINGSILDYAIKKERLLLEINKTIDKFILIDLIGVGLPNHIADRIDRNNLNNTEDLFNEIRGLEHLVKLKPVGKRNNNKVNSDNKKDTNEEKRPCKICEKKGKGGRYHPESACWFKNTNYVKHNEDQLHTANHSELEVKLNEENPKN